MTFHIRSLTCLRCFSSQPLILYVFSLPFLQEAHALQCSSLFQGQLHRQVAVVPTLQCAVQVEAGEAGSAGCCRQQPVFAHDDERTS